MRKSKPSVPVAYIRGGTSKALFFHGQDVPKPGPARDRFLLRMMGTPDPVQIDGMGGTHIVTSKVAIVEPSTRPVADVGINDPSVDYNANCGNISAGVGPFAIQEGLVNGFRQGVSLDSGRIQTREVRIFNTGTQKVSISHVAVDQEDGMPLEEQGDFNIAGCPREAAPILMDYRHVVGAALKKGAFLTGSAVDVVETPGKQVEYTVYDVANIIIFAHARDFGITGSETSMTLCENEDLVASVKRTTRKSCTSTRHVSRMAQRRRASRNVTHGRARLRAYRTTSIDPVPFISGQPVPHIHGRDRRDLYRGMVARSPAQSCTSSFRPEHRSNSRSTFNIRSA